MAHRLANAATEPRRHLAALPEAAISSAAPAKAVSSFQCSSREIEYHCANLSSTPDCRTKKRDDIPDALLPLTEEHELETRAAFSTADIDGSGNVTLDQYLDYMKAEKRSLVHIDWFNQ